MAISTAWRCSAARRWNQANAVSRWTAAVREARSACATAASRSKRSALALRLSARVKVCITLMGRMVMKSRVVLKRSTPSTGRLSSDRRSTGSGCWAAATARSREAAAATAAAAGDSARAVAAVTASCTETGGGAPASGCANAATEARSRMLRSARGGTHASGLRAHRRNGMGAGLRLPPPRGARTRPGADRPLAARRSPASGQTGAPMARGPIRRRWVDARARQAARSRPLDSAAPHRRRPTRLRRCRLKAQAPRRQVPRSRVRACTGGRFQPRSACRCSSLAGR